MRVGWEETIMFPQYVQPGDWNPKRKLKGQEFRLELCAH